MLNAAQFSAAKSVATSKLIQAEIFDENKNVRTFPKFKESAEKIADTVNETWLRVEYETSRRQCVMSEQYLRMYADRDLYPYWVYKGRMDDRERDEHVALEGKVFRIGDPEGDACMPENGFNCRCEAEPVDDDHLQEHGLTPVGPNELRDLIDNNIDEQFRRSPAAGSLPNNGSYFEAMKSANQGNAAIFGLPDPESNADLEGLAAKGVHHLAEIVDEWKQDYHVNKNGDVVFQNAKTFSNVRFTPNSLHATQKHSRGFENIPEAVSKPDEIWSSWDDDKKQLKSIRNYIIFGKVNYVVQTLAGEITDAFAVNKGSINKYRKGVIL